MQATMEHMTIWGLINDASLLVKGVMLILLAASVLSWFLIVRRSAILRRSERDIESFTQRLRAPGDLGALYRESRDASNPDAGAEQVFVAAYSEYAQLRQQPGIDADGRRCGRQTADPQPGGTQPAIAVCPVPVAGYSSRIPGVALRRTVA